MQRGESPGGEPNAQDDPTAPADPTALDATVASDDPAASVGAHAAGDDRRRRRSADAQRSLLYQCMHVQETLGLDALVVTDQLGRRWCGAGDSDLTQFLAGYAPKLVTGGTRSAKNSFVELRKIKPDIEPWQITTCVIRAPKERVHLYVVGVGDSDKRAEGVVRAANGVRRILGFPNQQLPKEDPDVADMQARLQRAALVGFQHFKESGFAGVPLPLADDDSFDDRCYAEPLAIVLRPVEATLNVEGLTLGSIWDGYWPGKPEESMGRGVFMRRFDVGITELMTAVERGRCEVDVAHRHDCIQLPLCPGIRLSWDVEAGKAR